MKCPHCGAELALTLVNAPWVPDPFPKIEREEHPHHEVRAAVKEIKRSPVALFYRDGDQLREITWARTTSGRLYVQTGNYWQPVHKFGDVVDVDGNSPLAWLCVPL